MVCGVGDGEDGEEVDVDDVGDDEVKFYFFVVWFVCGLI